MDILFENNEYVAVNKPSGLVVHSDGRTDETTVAQWFVEHYPEARWVGEPIERSDGTIIERPGIVHRIDRETSGVLLLARTSVAYEHLKKLFKNRAVHKEYRVFVYGGFQESEGSVDRPIGRSPKDFRQWSAQRGARGKLREAQTSYSIIEQGVDEPTGEKVSYLSVSPHTGRTHQIRVHMKAINHQVVCDTLYAPKRPQVLGFERLALHAHKISFRDEGGKDVFITAPLPPDFRNATQALGETF